MERRGLCAGPKFSSENSSPVSSRPALCDADRAVGNPSTLRKPDNHPGRSRFGRVVTRQVADAGGRR